MGVGAIIAAGIGLVGTLAAADANKPKPTQPPSPEVEQMKKVNAQLLAENKAADQARGVA